MKYFITLLIATGTSFLSTAQVSKTAKADSIQIRTTIMSFYNWYLKNNSKLNSFELYTGVKSKEGPPYKIDWKEAEKYFAFIRSSVPQLGESFIKNQRIFLKECDSAFKVDLEDDIPYGFDYDWYTNSQEEASYLVDELKKSKQWIIWVTGMDAGVEVMGYNMEEGKKVEFIVMCFGVKKEKGKWKIERIGCKSPENEPPPEEK